MKGERELWLEKRVEELEMDLRGAYAASSEQFKRAEAAEVSRLTAEISEYHIGVDFWRGRATKLEAEVSRLREREWERESREGCRSANCEKVGGSADHPHPAHPSLGALYGKAEFEIQARCDRDEIRRLRTRFMEVDAENARLREALREIEKGEGAFSRDPLTHAGNCIEAMKACAREALAPGQPEAAWEDVPCSAAQPEEGKSTLYRALRIESRRAAIDFAKIAKAWGKR